jgi:hypothetical protein
MRTLAAVWAVIVANLALVSARAADEPEAPGLDFLEYLGSWQEQDEEWVARAGWENADDEKRNPDVDADARVEPEDTSNED